MQSEQVWQAALGQLQLEMSKGTFDTWVRDTALLTYEDGLYVVGVPNAYTKDWLDHRLLSTVKRTLTSVTGRTVEVGFVVWPGNKKDEARPEIGPLGVEPANGGQETLGPLPVPAILNPKYMFETFVVGPSNRLAHAACLAAAENPARAYSPIFLFGGGEVGEKNA